MVSGPDLSPGRIAKLPHSGQVAFAARCALRVLPAARPAPTPRDRAVSGFRAAEACCFVPMHVALSPQSPYRAIALRASEQVTALADVGPGLARLASKGLAVAAQTAATDDLADSHLLVMLIAVYHDVAGSLKVYEAFDAAADADVAELERYHLERMAPVPLEFFARPLFGADGGVPREWQPVLAEWAALLGIVELSSSYELYMKLCAGTPLGIETVTSLIEAWVQGEASVHGTVAQAAPATPRRAEATPGLTAADSPPAVEAPAPAPERAPAAPTPTPPTPTAPEASPQAAAAAAADAPEQKETTPPEPELLLLADRPVEKADRDLLGFKDYAQSLAVILNDRVATPFTMAINAPWGAGKTSLANMLVERLLAVSPSPVVREPHIILRFNAWMYDDAANLASPLVTEVCRAADRKRPPWRRFFQPLPGPMLEPSLRRWRNGIYFLIVIVLTLLFLWQVSEHLTHVEGRQKYDALVNETYQQTTSRTPDGAPLYTDETSSQTRPRTPPPAAPADLGPVDEALKWLQPRMVLLGTFLTAFAGLVGVFVKVLSSTSLASFVQSPEKAAEGGSIQAAQRTIGRLIRDATKTGNRFFVFIDDIERCKPPRAIDVLDAVSQLLDHPNVVVVLLGDMSAVAAAAQVKYKDLAKIYVPAPDLAALSTAQRQEIFGRLYIQKIVQYQFDLPTLSRKRIKEYVAQLLESEDVTTKRDGGTTA